VTGASPLRELALVFLRIGITGVGGPAAHIALMEHETVHRRQWMDRRAPPISWAPRT
jgi:chromate transporter